MGDVVGLKVAGMREVGRLGFVSGFAILMELFESLDIKHMGLARGALREGG